MGHNFIEAPSVRADGAFCRMQTRRCDMGGKSMNRRELVSIAILTLLIAFMDITGIPSTFFVHIQAADIDPMYFVLMINFLIIGALAFLYLRILCPAWKLGFTKAGLADGFRKYGLAGAAAAIAGLIAFYVGLSPFDRQPSAAKVFVEGVLYYIGVAVIEELYVRGLLLNLLEKLFVKSKNSTLLAVVISAGIFGFGHIFGVLNQPPLVIVSKVVWTVGMGIFFGMVYKKTNNLWLPILFHFLINVCALPYCFSSISGYADLTLYSIVPVYILLGIYSFLELQKGT